MSTVKLFSRPRIGATCQFEVKLSELLVVFMRRCRSFLCYILSKMNYNGIPCLIVVDRIFYDVRENIVATMPYRAPSHANEN